MIHIRKVGNQRIDFSWEDLIPFANVKKRLFIQPDLNKEIMRRDIVVLGFFIIVLILTAGCSSTQNGAPSGAKSQNSVPWDVNVKTTSTSSYTSPSECKLQPIDPILFQKFFPNVPGWTRKYSGIEKYGIYEGTSYNNEIYSLSDKSKPIIVSVQFFSMGSCVTESTGVNWYLNNEKIGEIEGIITSRINNFHGYPAIHKITNASISIKYLSDIVMIGINNRYYVSIGTAGEEYSLSDAEANIETFANAIDFNGFAGFASSD